MGSFGLYSRIPACASCYWFLSLLFFLISGFQECKDPFDLILTCEERVYDQVVEDMDSGEQETCQPVHVINVNILDTRKEATLGAFLICDLCQCVQLMGGSEGAHV